MVGELAVCVEERGREGGREGRGSEGGREGGRERGREGGRGVGETESHGEKMLVCAVMPVE